MLLERKIHKKVKISGIIWWISGEDGGYQTVDNYVS